MESGESQRRKELKKIEKEKKTPSPLRNALHMIHDVQYEKREKKSSRKRRAIKGFWRSVSPKGKKFVQLESF